MHTLFNVYVYTYVHFYHSITRKPLQLCRGIIAMSLILAWPVLMAEHISITSSQPSSINAVNSPSQVHNYGKTMLALNWQLYEYKWLLYHTEL